MVEMSRAAILVLILLAFVGWFVPLLWVAFHDKGFPAGASTRPGRPPLIRLIASAAGMWVVLFAVVMAIVLTVNAIFPPPDG